MGRGGPLRSLNTTDFWRQDLKALGNYEEPPGVGSGPIDPKQ